jgi:hypothetical protein
MKKILLKVSSDIYAINSAGVWEVVGEGEPTDVMFIRKGMTNISIAQLNSLLVLTSATAINVLASNQGDAVTASSPITTAVTLDSGYCRSVDIDLTEYADVTNIVVREA